MPNYSSSPLTTNFPSFSTEIKPDFRVSLQQGPQLPGMQQLMQKDLELQQNKLENTYLKGMGQFAIDALDSPSGVIKNLGKSAINTAFTTMNKSLTKKLGSITIPTSGNSGSNRGGLSNFLGNVTPYAQGLSIAGGLAQSLGGVDAENASIRGGIAQGLSAIQGIASNFGPIGGAVSMGIGALTSVMNIADAIGGKKADTFTRDDEAFAEVGSSYGGTSANAADALSKSGKKYGIFSGSKRDKANAAIAEAKRQQGIMSNIADESRTRKALQGSMSAINSNRYALELQGGYDQRALRVGKQGLKINLDKARSIVKKKIKIPIDTDDYIEVLSLDEDQKAGRKFIGKNKNGQDLYLKGDGTVCTKRLKEGGQITEPEFKEGGSVIELVEPIVEFKEGGSIIKESVIELTEPIPEFKEGSSVDKKPRTLYELITYAKKQNPRFIQRLSEPSRGITFTDDNGNEAKGSHYLEWSTDDKGNAIIYPRIQEVDKELKFFNSKDAYNRAIENNNILIMSPEEAEIFFSEDQNYGTAYKSGWPQFFDKFKNGGSVNLIPEGALHARKHNIDMEGITHKGIPVVANDGEQQAEIEKEELIFRLEITQKLEELQKKYYSDGISKKEKDELALEAGKLLVKETLYNTDDKIGLLKEINI